MHGPVSACYNHIQILVGPIKIKRNRKARYKSRVPKNTYRTRGMAIVSSNVFVWYIVEIHSSLDVVSFPDFPPGMSQL